MPQISSALSFCEVDGRYVFLDLPGDRYFCIDGTLASAWQSVLQGTDSAEQRALLQRHGLIVEAGGRPLLPCRESSATRSLLDHHRPTTPTLQAWAHAWRVRQMGRRIARKGMAGAIGSYLEAKRHSGLQTADHEELASIAMDFSRFDMFVATLNRCLPRSLALATVLARRGFSPDLVFAVHLGPFSAHCWVECEGLLVNDRLERVRQFQPILRL